MACERKYTEDGEEIVGYEDDGSPIWIPHPPYLSEPQYSELPNEVSIKLSASDWIKSNKDKEPMVVFTGEECVDVPLAVYTEELVTEVVMEFQSTVRKYNDLKGIARKLKPLYVDRAAMRREKPRIVEMFVMGFSTLDTYVFKNKPSQCVMSKGVTMNPLEHRIRRQYLQRLISRTFNAILEHAFPTTIEEAGKKRAREAEKKEVFEQKQREQDAVNAELKASENKRQKELHESIRQEGYNQAMATLKVMEKISQSE